MHIIYISFLFLKFTRVSTRVSKMKKDPVTQQDIARKLKVSRITVSKALRNHPDISEAMKERVRKASIKMGYSPNLIAARLSMRKTFTIGVIIPDLENSFFAYLTDTIIDSANERDYNIILTVSRENAVIEKKNITNLIGMRVDGLLVCLSQQTTDPEIFNYAAKMGIPLVFFDRAFRDIGFSYVVFDDRNGTRTALDTVIGDGFREIAHFAGYANTSIGRDRRDAFRQSLRKHCIEIKKEWIIEGGYEINDGYNAFRNILNSGKLPEIILTVNDRVALGAYKAAAEAGLLIPDDIGIIGYGFSETAELFNPVLSIINQDPRNMGRIAAGMLMDEIEGNSEKKGRVLIGEEFLWNGSVRRKSPPAEPVGK